MLTLLLCLLLGVEDAEIEKLLRGSAEERARIQRVLLREGTPAIARLEPHAKTHEHVRTLIQEIRKREPKGLLFSIGLPKMALTTDVVNGKEFSFSIRVENKSGKKVVLYPLFEARLLDSDGNEVKTSRRLGRGGRSLGRHRLKQVLFATIEPGKRADFTDRLTRFMHDPNWILGWKIKKPGTYTLELTYRYFRKQAEGLDDKKHDAYKAVELTHTFRQTLKIT